MANEKFCGSCGTKLNANAGFCPSCGAKQNTAPEAVMASAPVAEQTAPVIEETVPVENEGGATAQGLDLSNLKKYAPIIGIVAAVVVVAIIAIVLVVNLTKYQKIDPSELCRVTFEGLESDPDVTVSFAYDEETTCYLDLIGAFDEDFDDVAKAVSKLDSKDINEMFEMNEVGKDYLKENYKDLKASNYLSIDEDTLLEAFTKAGDEDEALEMRDALLDCITFELDYDPEKDEIKNGDTLTVEVDFDEEDLKEYNIKLTKTSFEVKVSGLMVSEELDVMKDVKIEFSGTDEYGEAVVNTDACSDFVKENFSIYTYDNSYLSNGDTVTVYYYFDYNIDYDYDYKGAKNEADNIFYTFEASGEKEYTVEGLKGLEEIDAFEYVEIKYGGSADYPSVDAYFMEGTPDYIVDNVSLSDDAYGLDYVEGETFTVSLYSYNGLKEAGYVLSREEKVFSVDMTLVPKYAKAADVKADTYSDVFESQIQSELEGYTGRNFTLISGFGSLDEVTSITLKATYFQQKTAEAYSWYDENKLYKIYEIKCKHSVDDVTSDGTFYVVGCAEEVCVSGDEFAQINYISMTVYDDYNTAIEACSVSNEDYTATEIK